MSPKFILHHLVCSGRVLYFHFKAQRFILLRHQIISKKSEVCPRDVIGCGLCQLADDGRSREILCSCWAEGPTSGANLNSISATLAAPHHTNAPYECPWPAFTLAAKNPSQLLLRRGDMPCIRLLVQYKPFPSPKIPLCHVHKRLYQVQSITHPSPNLKETWHTRIR